MTQPLHFEHRRQKLASRRVLIQRLSITGSIGLASIAVSLAIGMLGYHLFERLDWLDAFVNAAMILSGMGPLHTPQTTGGKLFAGCYALYSGIAVLLIAGVTFSPLVHRFLHRLHADFSEEQN